MTGGGTGGHLAIIQAVKAHLHHPKPIYIGSTQGQDRAWFEGDSAFEATYFFQTRGVVNQGLLGKLKSLWMVFRATLQALRLLRKHHASVVFSVGGFSSAPTALASKLLGIPLVIHEQNAALGSLNRLLRPYATHFISSYLPDSPIQAYPIKEQFFAKARIRSRVDTIIFLGGSQGANAINTLALDLAPTLHARGIKIIHQAGEKHIDTVTQAYEALGIDAEVFGFTTTLDEKMAQADFAIARSGASTLWELSATALPTLFIPYPYAASDHQYHNAQFLVAQHLAWLIREADLTPQTVLPLLDQDLTPISQGLRHTIQRGGAQEIAELLSGYEEERGDIR